jgi:hypothetical protein
VILDWREIWKNVCAASFALALLRRRILKRKIYLSFERADHEAIREIEKPCDFCRRTRGLSTPLPLPEAEASVEMTFFY